MPRCTAAVCPQQQSTHERPFVSFGTCACRQAETTLGVARDHHRKRIRGTATVQSDVEAPKAAQPFGHHGTRCLRESQKATWCERRAAQVSLSRLARPMRQLLTGFEPTKISPERAAEAGAPRSQLPRPPSKSRDIGARRL
eukprot:5656106-Prymnesium_polylepis.1